MLLVQSLYNTFDQSNDRKRGDEEVIEGAGREGDAREERSLDVAGDDEGRADLGGIVTIKRVLAGTGERWQEM